MQQGVEKLQCGQSQAALHSWQQALTIFQEIGDRQGEGSALGALGNAYHSLEDYVKAIEYNKQHLVSAQEVQDRQGEGVALGNLGFAYYSLGDYDQAMKYQQQSLTIAREVKNRYGEGTALLNLGLAYSSVGNYDKATEHLLLSLEIAQETTDRYGEGQSLGALGSIDYALKNYEEAIEFYRQCLIVKQEVQDRKGEAVVLKDLGRAYHALKDYDKAVESYQEYLAIVRELQDSQEEWATLGTLGLAYREQGYHTKALECFEQGLMMAWELQDRQKVAMVLGDLAVTYRIIGKCELAIDYHQQRLAITRQIQDRQGEGTALQDLGVVYTYLGDNKKAIEHHHQHLVIAQELHDCKEEWNALLNLGNAYYLLGDYVEAIDYYKQGWATVQKLSDHQEEEGEVLGNLANVYHALGDYNIAIKYNEQQFAIAQKLNHTEGKGRALSNLGTDYHALEDYGKAIDYYQQALVIARELHNRQREAEVLGNLGSAYHDLGDDTKSIEYLQQSLAITREINYRLAEGQALGNLGLAYSSLGDYGKAIECQQKRLVIARDIQDSLGEAQALTNFGSHLFESDQPVEAERILRAAIKVLESLRERLGNNDAYKISIFDTQVLAYCLLQKVLIAQNQINAALEIAEEGRARAFVELLSRHLSTESATQVSSESLTIKDIKKIAKNQNATLVEYSIYSLIYHDFLKRQGRYWESELFIWIIKPNGEIAFCLVDLKPLREQQNTSLSDLVTQARESLGVEEKQRGTTPTTSIETTQPIRHISEPLQQLHQYLIEPIASLLPTDPNAPVIFIPQGALFLVPFPALQDKEGNFLIEYHTILTAPSIQTLELTRQQRQRVGTIHESPLQSQDVLVVGNPTMPTIPLTEPPKPLHALPGSEAEAEAIASLFNTLPIIGDKATKVYIEKLMPTARLIHLATHGLSDDIKQLGVPGAIALAPSGKDNGFLTAGEIYEMKLNAELVVLSACHSGQGKITGDGVVGLSRCLFAAGVPSVIVSLWSVGDDSTQFLMSEFYQNLQNGMNKAQALRQAMLTIIADYSEEPQCWAAFTLLGEAE